MADDAAILREHALAKLRSAVGFATAGELVRAAQFLDFAREVRSGKRRLRAASKTAARQRVTDRYGYYADN